MVNRQHASQFSELREAYTRLLVSPSLQAVVPETAAENGTVTIVPPRPRLVVPQTITFRLLLVAPAPCTLSAVVLGLGQYGEGLTEASPVVALAGEPETHVHFAKVFSKVNAIVLTLADLAGEATLTVGTSGDLARASSAGVIEHVARENQGWGNEVLEANENVQVENLCIGARNLTTEIDWYFTSSGVLFNRHAAGWGDARDKFTVELAEARSVATGIAPVYAAGSPVELQAMFRRRC